MQVHTQTYTHFYSLCYFLFSSFLAVSLLISHQRVRERLLLLPPLHTPHSYTLPLSLPPIYLRRGQYRNTHTLCAKTQGKCATRTRPRTNFSKSDKAQTNENEDIDIFSVSCRSTPERETHTEKKERER